LWRRTYRLGGSLPTVEITAARRTSRRPEISQSGVFTCGCRRPCALGVCSVARAARCPSAAPRIAQIARHRSRGMAILCQLVWRYALVAQGAAPDVLNQLANQCVKRAIGPEAGSHLLASADC